jgi:hypothetical protein
MHHCAWFKLVLIIFQLIVRDTTLKALFPFVHPEIHTPEVINTLAKSSHSTNIQVPEDKLFTQS